MILIFYFFIFWPSLMADRISVPPSGTELTPTALEADSLYHCQGSPQNLIFKEQLVQWVNNISQFWPVSWSNVGKGVEETCVIHQFMLCFGASKLTFTKQAKCSTLWDPSYIKVFYSVNGWLDLSNSDCDSAFLKKCAQQIKVYSLNLYRSLFHASLVFP